eukprot:TRINITY_DN39542_c0_g1_i1.p1 TRINITY_DN39542_c0_g1~~TRINITY_DN39542_c0_g1_i1.p1  ORF type:complete len:241 (+),score=27.54 TRINITY_DN39542_c0_g1_i1:398-1120(+)
MEFYLSTSLTQAQSFSLTYHLSPFYCLPKSTSFPRKQRPLRRSDVHRGASLGLQKVKGGSHARIVKSDARASNNDDAEDHDLEPGASDEPAESATSDDASEQGFARQSNLSVAIKRKMNIVRAQIEQIGSEAVQEQLADYQQKRMQAIALGERDPSLLQPQALMELLAERAIHGRTTVIAELARLSPSEEAESLASRAREYVEWGADALLVCCNEEETSNGLADLRAVCRGMLNESDKHG